MIPSVIRYMHGFPLTVNGKIDRKALNVESNEFENREKINFDALSTTEEIIYKIWCDALKTDDIVLADNFFEIGGNSLMAVSVLAKIEATFKIELGLRVFFDSPKIKDIAEAVDLKVKKEEPETSLKMDGNIKIVNGEI